MTMLLKLFKETADRLFIMNNAYVTNPGDQITNEILLERAAAALEAYTPKAETTAGSRMMLKIGGERLLLTPDQANAMIAILHNATKITDNHWTAPYVDPAAPKYMHAKDSHPLLELQLLDDAEIAPFISDKDANAAYEKHKAATAPMAVFAADADVKAA